MSENDHYVDPTPELFAAFKALDRETPILMLNMLRFRDQAAYPDGHAQTGKDLSGADAYQLYGKESGPVFAKVGGEIVWRGDYQTMVIGPQEEYWDTVFIARYPNAHAFLQMIADPDYKIAVVNRQAAVATSRLIRFGETTGGIGFGD